MRAESKRRPDIQNVHGVVTDPLACGSVAHGAIGA